MAKTLLEYVQHTLSTMDSDQIDAIGDTEESIQVAELLKEVYYEFLNRDDWPWLERGVIMTSLSDTTKPTHLTIDPNTKILKSVRYRRALDNKFTELRQLDPCEMIERLSSTGDSRQEVEAVSGVYVNVRTDKHPEFWASFNDTEIVLDSFESEVESFIQGTKASTWGSIIPGFQVTDTFEPLVPPHLEPALQAFLNRAAHLYYKQQDSAPDAVRELRQLAQAHRRPSKTVDQTDGFFRNRFGRK